MQLCSILNIFVIALLSDWNENWPLPVLRPLLHFPDSLTYWVQHFHSIFSIWNSSAGIPTPPLALFIVMLPKAHLTSHSGMSGSRWVITPLWLSGSLISFLYNPSVYYCHCFLVSSASVRSIPFLLFIAPNFAWNVPLVSLIFLKRSLVFPILFFSSLSLHWSLKKALLSFLAILWNSAFQWVGITFLFSFVFRFSSFHSYL